MYRRACTTPTVYHCHNKPYQSNWYHSNFVLTTLTIQSFLAFLFQNCFGHYFLSKCPQKEDASDCSLCASLLWYFSFQAFECMSRFLGENCFLQTVTSPLWLSVFFFVTPLLINCLHSQWFFFFFFFSLSFSLFLSSLLFIYFSFRRVLTLSLKLSSLFFSFSFFLFSLPPTLSSSSSLLR